MKKLWILILLPAFAGCQPDVQQSPGTPPVAAEKADAQEKVTPVPVAPVPQQEQARGDAPALKVQSAQSQLEADKPAVVTPRPVVTAPVKNETPVLPAQESDAKPAQLSEADAMALAKKKNCFACHALDKKMVGPAWQAVAQKYRGQADAQAVLEAKVRKGGKGNWGSVAMPPQPALSSGELTGLVQFVLRLQ